jgi:glycerophosphoryl diester phosphodiesterase
MPLISHRGAAHLDIANSAAAISEGDAYQPAYIEIDINCTSDDVLVIYHGSISRFLQGKKLKETFAELHARFPDLLTLEHVLSIYQCTRSCLLSLSKEFLAPKLDHYSRNIRKIYDENPTRFLSDPLKLFERQRYINNTILVYICQIDCPTPNSLYN